MPCCIRQPRCCYPLTASSSQTNINNTTNIGIDLAQFTNQQGGTFAENALIPVTTQTINTNTNQIVFNSNTLSLKGDGIFQISFGMTLSNPSSDTINANIGIQINGTTQNLYTVATQLTENQSETIFYTMPINIPLNTTDVITLINLTKNTISITNVQIIIEKVS